MTQGTIIFGRRKKLKRQSKPYKRKVRWSNRLTPKAIAVKYVKEDMGLSADVKQIPIPGHLIKMTERHLHAKFKKVPVAYVYFPKKGRHFDKMRRADSWAGMSIIPEVHTNTKGFDVVTPLKAHIIFPKSELADERVKNVTLLHELSEILAHQKECELKTPEIRSYDLVKEFENRIGRSKSSIDKRAKNLFIKKESWK